MINEFVQNQLATNEGLTLCLKACNKKEDFDDEHDKINITKAPLF